MGIENRGCALFLMGWLLVSSVLVFPYYIQPDPPIEAAICFSLLPLVIFVYVLFLTLCVW